MKRFLPLIAITASGFAADRCAPEAPNCYSQDDCEHCYCLGPAQIIANAPVRPVTCDGDISLSVAGLYWKATQDGMEYAVDDAVRLTEDEVSDLGSGTMNNLIDAHYRTPDFKWNFGFKVGLSYASACDGWDIGIYWTSYQGKAHSHIEAEKDDNHILVTLWSAFPQFPNWGSFSGFPSPVPYANDIETNWKLDLNLIDILLGREFWVSRYLSLRPFVGLRIASLKQTFHLEHKGGVWVFIPSASQTIPPTFPHLNDEVSLENDFFGVGVRGGFDTYWHLGCGWALYGSVASSIVYGRFDIDHDEWTREAETPFTKTRILETEDHFRASRAIFDLDLGIQYSALVCDCKYGLTASLGWEQHLFFHQNQMWRVEEKFNQIVSSTENLSQKDFAQRRGNLSTQGLTLKIQFDF